MIVLCSTTIRPDVLVLDQGLQGQTLPGVTGERGLPGFKVCLFNPLTAVLLTPSLGGDLSLTPPCPLLRYRATKERRAQLGSKETE